MNIKIILNHAIENISFRKELTKLRISNRNLSIERGQYCSPKLPREERLCSLCSECKLEDEKYFLLDSMSVLI